MLNVKSGVVCIQGQRIYHIRAKIAAGKANAFRHAKGICGNIRPPCPNPDGSASMTFPNAFALGVHDRVHDR